LKIILASGSPRRRDLLQEVGIHFSVEIPDIDESPHEREHPKKMVTRLAREKALAILNQHPNDDVLIIAADTTVVAPDGKTNLGKPQDAEDAFRMLRTLSGKTHTVFTGYAIAFQKKGKKQIKFRTVQTRVTLRKLSQSVLRDYVGTQEPMDKAGSYAAQGKGMALITEIRGSYSNVVGLPISHLVEDLEQIAGIEVFK
jgi:septum formation protein